MKGRLRGAHCSGACSWKEGEPGFQLWAVSITGKPDPFFPPFLHTPRTGRSEGQWSQAVAVRLSRRQKPGLTTWAGRPASSPGCPGFFNHQKKQRLWEQLCPGPLYGGPLPASAPGGLEGGCLPPEGRGLHLGLCRPLTAMDSLPCGRERTLRMGSEVPLPGRSINNQRVILDRSHHLSEPRFFGL